jgi:hypothetical protein
MGRNTILQSLRTAVGFCRSRNGWQRIGFALSLGIIAVALAALYQTLECIDVDETIVALHAMPAQNIALTACFVSAGY